MPAPTPTPAPATAAPPVPASTTPDDIQPILDPVKVDPGVKAKAWDAWHAASDETQFRAAFDTLPLPNETKAALWDAKFNHSAPPAAPSTAPPVDPVSGDRPARPARMGPMESFWEDVKLGHRAGLSQLEHTAANIVRPFSSDTATTLEDKAKSNQPTQEEMVGREGFVSAVGQGIGSLPTTLAKYAPALLTKRFGPAVGGVIDAVGASDQGPLAALKAGLTTAASFAAQEKMAKLPTRLGRTLGSAAAMAVPAAIESGGDVQKTAAAAALGAGMGGIAPKPVKAEIPKPVEGFMGAIESAKDDIAKSLAPGSRSPEAAKTIEIGREHLANAAQRADRAEYILRDARSYFDSQPPDPSIPGGMSKPALDFVQAIEGGKIETLPPELQGQGQAIRDMFDDRMARLQKYGLLNQFVENYFPHLWDKPDEAAKAFSTLSKAPLEGSKGFLKQRKFATIQEGLEFAAENPEYGLKLATDNPIDMVILKLREQDKLLTARDILSEMKENKLMKFVPNGESTPNGYVQIDDKVSSVMYRKNGALISAGNWVAPEPAARVINNYLSPGLKGKPWFRATNLVGNMMNQFQLGWSAFHLGFTTYDATMSNFSLGLEKIVHGVANSDPKFVTGGIKDFLKAPFRAIDPIVSHIPGSGFLGLRETSYSNKLWEEWMKPGSHPDMAPLVEYAKQAGGRVQMDPFYRTQMWRNMKKAWISGNHIMAATRALPALTEQVMVPIMEHIVPRQKMAAFARMAEFEIERLEPGASPQDIRRTMQKAWDSVDNRMGQLVYDNKFWDNTAKDLMQASVRSVGWNWGTFAELPGGALDFATVMQRVNRGERAFTHRMAYLATLPVATGIVGAVTTYLMTGTPPVGIKDYLFPRTGNVDEYGRAERISPPSYMNDVYKWGQHISREGAGKGVLSIAKGKVHPFLTTMLDMFTNEDWQGNHIHDPHDDNFLHARIADMKYVAEQFKPFALKNAMEDFDKAEKGLPPRHSNARNLNALIGIQTATAAVTKNDAEAYLDQHADESKGASSKDFDSEIAFGHVRDLERAFRANVDEEKIRAMAQPWIDKGELKEKQIETARERAATPPLVRRLKGAEFHTALHAYELALFDDSISSEEMTQLQQIMQKKAYSKLDALMAKPANDRDRVQTLAKFKELGLAGGEGEDTAPPPVGKRESK